MKFFFWIMSNNSYFIPDFVLVFCLVHQKNIFKHIPFSTYHSMAYLLPGSGVFRISKRGGPNFLLATSSHTKGGAKPSFPIFLVCPPKYASASWEEFHGLQANLGQHVLLQGLLYMSLTCLLKYSKHDGPVCASAIARLYWPLPTRSFVALHPPPPYTCI